MLECPHERAAKKSGNYDPELWEDGCMCPWNYFLIVGILVVLSPVLVPLVIGTRIHDWVKGINRRGCRRCGSTLEAMYAGSPHCLQCGTGK